MIFDGHSDIWYDVVARRESGERNVFDKRHYERLKKGRVEGGFFVLWIDPPNDTDPVKRVRQIMDAVRADNAESQHIRRITGVGEIEKAKADGKFYAFTGMEGLSCVEEDLSMIDELYDFGVRHADLTWNEQNLLGTGLDGDPDRGLTELGKRAVRKIQEKGMILDTCHNNDKTFWDIMDVAVGPVIASHSNCRALCDVPRNLTDDMLRAIRATGGIVGINSYGGFVSKDPTKYTADELARHVEHLVSIMDVHHVGFGFDFTEFYPDNNKDALKALDPEADISCFGSIALDGLQSAAEIPLFLATLRKVGFSEKEVVGLMRENWLHFIEKVVG